MTSQIDMFAGHGHSLSSLHALYLSGADVTVDIDLSFIAQMLLFSAFVVLLRPILFQPLVNLFEEREKRTEGVRVEARKMDEKAAALVKRFDDEIEKVRHAANQERERLRAEVVRIEQDILADAKKSSTAII